ncbi:hypothetical protein RHMOL_Rhmol04G0029000 [Rhododendron molle]|uniref:Uncharacterized protein n=1 Tax=Rhododendron molle TaxID=49168 RepID=A0ACC0NXI9_RHOML|nr:hypothetical protein RHMOL_Rhmol04G0029000 [Rhododendron molle]
MLPNLHRHHALLSKREFKESIHNIIRLPFYTSLSFFLENAMERQAFLTFFHAIFFSSTLLKFSIAADTLSASQSLRDGETLVSPSQKFELGFFSPGSSKNRYLGIWYVRTPDTVVWVANRNNPIIDLQGVLAISSDGGLILRNGTQSIIWSSNSTRVSAEEVITPIAQLLDSGNLLLIEKTKTDSVLWQSFDSMCDTRLPGMKLGANTNTGLDQHMTSWKAADDPSPGDFTYRIENKGLPQLVITMGSTKKYRTGPWNGLRFSGHQVRNNPAFTPVMEFNNTELISLYEPFNSVIRRSTLSQSGYLQRYVLNEKSGSWDLMFTAPTDLCDSYGQCGPNGFCRTSKAPICECLKGFSPKSQLEWEMLNWSKGCVRSVPLECQKGEGFVKVARVKLPDLLDQFQLNTNMRLRECKEKCLRDCSCIAYANSNISGRGNGCLMWFGDLIDTREFVPQDDSEQDIYIRLPESLYPKKKKKRLLKILLLSATSLTFCFICGCIIIKMNKKRRCLTKREQKGKKETLELPVFDLATISAATRNFSHENMVGEGGFGPVYKGKLSMGQEIAVKRLSKSSGQGLEEFKNEVASIAKLQHRNLVALLGCCIQGEETMLIYEYMSNKSLDYFIYDHNRKALLAWQKRFDIIMGIARGVLYLHQDSKLKIIHRDLKASNILLDGDLLPKISDFGGYMSPEYALDGKFSVKSDVFSLGVLLLEIVSGKRNRGFNHPDHHHSLLGHKQMLETFDDMDKINEKLEVLLIGFKLTTRKMSLSQQWKDLSYLFAYCLYYGVFSILITSNGVDTITTTKSLADGETIVSSGGIFELGFFSPGNSTNRYVGIWYKKILPIMTVVWVANRETPLFDKAGVLKLTSPGILVLVNSTNDTTWIWSTKTSRSAQDTIAQLFDSGNMVVRNSDDEKKAENFLWQSFDYPGNTLLPGMKLGKNFLTGQEWYVSSWKSDDDPGQGVFTYVLDTHGYPQMFIRNRSTDSYGSGPWNGLAFSGIQNPAPISRFFYDSSFNYDSLTDQVVYNTYEVTNSSAVTRSVLSHEGNMTLWACFDQTRSWLAMASVPKTSCDRYASCGSYGSCSINNSPVCGCLDKFVPKNPKERKLHDWSNGCVRRTPLSCQQEGGEDGFVKYSRVKLPDTRNSSFDRRMSLEECQRTCLGNCSCTAYANLDIRETGSGCLLWFGDLIDIKEFTEGGGQDIYVRMASSESVNVAGKDLLSFDFGGADNNTLTEARKSQNSRKGEVDLPRFSFASVSAATDNFFDANKLGEGGFGPIYKMIAFVLKSSGYMSPEYAMEADTLSSSQSLRDGETLVSPGQKFELGFFSPGGSKNRYLGIWYVITPDIVVWVANRNNSIIDLQGVLAISSDRGLILRNGTQSIIWSSNSLRVSAEEIITPIAQLLDSGNLVLIEKTKTDSVLWQSFDSMCDTRIPGMKLGANTNTGLGQHLTSWKAAYDPSPGDFTYRIENKGLPEFVMTMGSTKKYRSGPWNGLRFSGHQGGNNPAFKLIMEFNNTELISVYEPFNSAITRSTLSPSGYLQRYVLNEKSGSWDLLFTAPADLCDSYGQCGPNGICRTSKAPTCECLKGFSPKSQLEWEMLNWSKGCVRSVPLDCQKGEGFEKVANVKLPDLLDQFQLNTNMSLTECKEKCLGDCSCIAYANSNVSGRGNGCLMWFGDLIDTREFIPEDDSGQDIYIRLPESLYPKKKKKRLLKTLLLSATSLTFCFICGCIIIKMNKKRRGLTKREQKGKKENLELPVFDLATISAATRNFSHENMVGEGGFGSVYKGKLSMGQEIAVKRLSKSSGQGLEEFKNEVASIAKLQHRNLVALLGCCIQGEETMLIYEYMSNKSLDYFIYEYAIDGKFSVKSDVFSLGVLLLEIVSGKRNRGFNHPDHHHSLLGHAWLLWNEDKSLELMDTCLKDSCVESEVKRCIQVGLLCIQKLPEDRPAMSTVVSMLGSEGGVLPMPKEPGFFIERSSVDQLYTNDVATITILEAR